MDNPRRLGDFSTRNDEQDIITKPGYECDVDYTHDVKQRPAMGYDPEMKPTSPRAGKKDTLETEDNVYLVEKEKQMTPYLRNTIKYHLEYLHMRMEKEHDSILCELERRLMRPFSVYFLIKKKNYDHMLLPGVKHDLSCKHMRPEDLLEEPKHLYRYPGVFVLFDREAADAFNKVLDRYVYEIDLLAILVVTEHNDPSCIPHDIYHLLRNARKRNIYTEVTTQDTLAKDIDLAWENVCLKILKTDVKWMKPTMRCGWDYTKDLVTEISRKIGDVKLLPEQVNEQNADNRPVVIKQEKDLSSCYHCYIKPLVEEIESISQSEDMPRLKIDTEGLTKKKLKVLFLTKQKFYKQMLLPAVPFVKTENYALAYALSDDECKDHLVVVVSSEEQGLFWRDFERKGNRFVALLIINEDQQSTHILTLRNDICVKLTTKDTLAEDIDQTVERQILNGLKDCLEMLRKYALLSGLPTLKGQIHRLEQRVCGISTLIGDDQASDKSALEHDWALPQEKMDEMISRVNNIDNVIGCGFNKATLEIYIDESANTEGTGKYISELLKDYEVSYAVLKTKKNFRQFRSPGDGIFQVDEGGTLTGFVRSQRLVLALLCKHVAGDPGTTLYTMADNNPFGEVIHSNESLDLSLAKVTVDNYCTQFKNQNGSPLAVPCTVKENVDNLQDLPVYIYGARSRPGRGIIVQPRHVRKDSSGRGIHHVLIEDFSEKTGDFAQPGDSGAIVLSKLRCPKKKAWAIGVVLGKYESHEKHAGRYIALFLHAGLQHLGESFGQPLQMITD